MRLRFLFGVSLILVFTCGMAMAQGTAQISGTVMDPSGARARAEVTATQTATGVVRSVISNESGLCIAQPGDGSL